MKRRRPETRPTVTAIVALALAVLCRADPPAAPSGSLAERLKGVQNANNPLPNWQPISATAAAASHEIVIAPGLMMTGAVNQAGIGDYEATVTIDRVDENSVHLQYRATLPAASPQDTHNPGPGAGGQVPRQIACARLIDVPDMKTAHTYNEGFCGGLPEHMPGSTAISVSSEVLTQLRAGTAVPFRFRLLNPLMAYAQLGASVTGPGARAFDPKKDLTNGEITSMIDCSLRRVEPMDLAVPVLLNDRPVELPALHASCDTKVGRADFYILDHPGNAVVLASRGDPISGAAQVIKIQEASVEAIRQVNAAAAAAAAVAGRRSAMEQRLQDKKPVDVYGIYFDFNSATLRPESDAVLNEIAAVLRAHPDWKLVVAGHTDNIGAGTFNMDLSQRRAAAVKAALVSRFGLAADRLTTTGYGATRPVASNETLEGRARNRRVELQRQ